MLFRELFHPQPLGAILITPEQVKKRQLPIKIIYYGFYSKIYLLSCVYINVYSGL
ncbi:hypothetical protein ABIC60_003936 [Phyllobacterium ifriqiyense]